TKAMSNLDEMSNCWDLGSGQSELSIRELRERCRNERWTKFAKHRNCYLRRRARTSGLGRKRISSLIKTETYKKRPVCVGLAAPPATEKRSAVQISLGLRLTASRAELAEAVRSGRPRST